MRKFFVILILIFAGLIIYDYVHAQPTTTYYYDSEMSTCFCKRIGLLDDSFSYIPCNKIPYDKFYIKNTKGFFHFHKATPEEFEKYKDK